MTSTVATRDCSLCTVDPSQLRDLDAVVDGLAADAAAAGCDVRRLGVAEPPPIDLRAALRRALARPRGAPPLRELARGRRNAVIITSDASRPVPTHALLGPVLAELEAAGIGADAVDVVIGGGAHRPPYREEVEALVGKPWAGRLRVSCHDYRSADLVDLGRTPAGTPLRIDARVAAADLRIAFGQVEPHEFAGFTGGRKAILPAVAGEETILANHSLANLSHPHARPGILEGNPIHEDMLAAAKMARLDFIVNVALGGDLQPLAVAAGDAEAAHAELTGFVRGFAELRRPEGPVDVVVTGPGAPLDINLYQSIKPLVGLQPMVEGMAPRTLRWRLRRRAPVADPPGVRPSSSCSRVAGTGRVPTRCSSPLTGPAVRGRCSPVCDRHYTVETNETFNIARFLTVCPHVVACCPGVPDRDLQRLFFTPAPTPDAALETALALARADAQSAASAATARRPVVLFLPRAHRALFAAWDQDAAAGPSPSALPRPER